jgi:glucose-1-phosphate cytidylyltransferase
MKVVILAGGYGTRISEESHLRPKPMIEIGGMPILWHIMKYYSHYGHNEFIICAGYKQYVIKEFFNNYFLHNSDVTFDYSSHDKLTVHLKTTENWKVTVIDTGMDTMTGGRIKRIRPYLNGESFLLTYGDGLSDVNIDKLIDSHVNSNSLLTLTAIKPEGRFGFLDIIDSNKIKAFREKSRDDVGWINGGFMVVENSFIDFIDDDDTILEQTPMKMIAEQNKLSAYKHDGFWQCMDTLRDKNKLEDMFEKNVAPWKVW